MSDTSPERFRQIDALFDAALDLPSGQHEAFLAQEAGGDPALAAEVRRLLEAYRASGDFLERPLAAQATPLLRGVWDDAPGATVEVAAPERVGPFRLTREIGRGGMGAVFLGERDDGEFEQRVALKLVRRLGTDDAVVRRFREERRILARLEHPRIARLLDGGLAAGGAPWFAMEYIDGERLDTWCDSRQLPIDRRLALFATACEAVQHAHQQLVVHRDLKPSNILVTPAGELKLLDFGIAKLLDAGLPARDAGAGVDEGDGDPATVTIAMTPQYAAPEQVRGEPATAATDVYALGVLLYELLTGRRPYDVRGRTPGEIERIVCEVEPPPPSGTFDAAGEGIDDRVARARARGTTPDALRRRLRGDLDAIAMRALRKEPGRRYPSAAALLDDIARARDGRPVLARPDSVAYRARRFARRHRGALALAAGVLVLLGAGFVRERTLRQRAEDEARKSSAVEEYMVSVFNVADPYAARQASGEDVTARTLLERGVARIDRELADQPDVQAELRGAFGRVYANLGLFDRAEDQWRRALAQRRAMHGERHADVAVAMSRLGNVLSRRQRYDEADSLLRGALALQRELADDGRETATTLDYLAEMHRERGEVPVADSLVREALALRRRFTTTNADSSALADAINNVGLLHFIKGEYDQAEPLYREALGVSVAVLGENHPNTARILQNLAQTQQQRGQLDEAEALFRRSLDAKRAALGDEHPSVTIGMNNLGHFLATTRGKVDAADSLFRVAIALDRRMFGENHGYVAAGLNNLATAARLRGDFAEAARLSGEAAAMAKRVYPGPHRETAAYLSQVGSSRLLAGDLAGARDALREAVEQYRGALGEQHLFTQLVSVNLARVLFDLGDVAGAERGFRDALATLDSSKAPNRPVVVTAGAGLARVMLRQGRSREAIPIIERTVSMAREHMGPKDPRTGDAVVALGQVLHASGEREKGLERLREGVALLEPVEKTQPRLLAGARRALEAAERGSR